MKIRGWLIAIALALLSGLLAGCGGGAKQVSSTRALVPVTVKIQFPNSGKRVGRAFPAAAQSVSLEVFNGAVRVQRVGLTVASPTATLQVPPGPLTFYANAYPDATAPDYVTAPATGLPAAPSNNPSLARGVTTQEVPIANGQPLVFAMTNNVVALLPNLTPGQSYISVPVDNVTGAIPGTLALTNLLTAKDEQGNTLLLPDNAVAWSVDTADPLAAQKAAIDTVNPLLLDLKGTGQVNLIARQKDFPETNSGQQKIQGVFTILITPATSSVALQANVTQIPLYAKSVTLTVSQNPFNAGDTPPASVATTTATLTLAAPPTTQNATLALPNFKPTGRAISLTAQAWSNSDGTGALVGVLTLNAQAVSATAYNMPLVNNVAGFSISPVSSFIGGNAAHPGIYQTAAGSLTTPTTVTLRATLIVYDAARNPVQTGQAVDPATLLWASDNNLAATVNGSGVVTSVGPIPPQPVNIIAYDRAAPAPPAAGSISGTIDVTILSNAGNANIGIN